MSKIYNGKIFADIQEGCVLTCIIVSARYCTKRPAVQINPKNAIQKCNRRHFIAFYLYLLKKIRLGFSYEYSSRGFTWFHMKYQLLFSV